jgi:pilus assembly protein CpaE
MLRIAIVDPSDITRDPLRSLLLGIDFVWLEAECARYEFFTDVIQQFNPDLVIIATDSDRAKSSHLISQINAEAPHLPILAIGADNSAVLQALQNGARYFLTQPFQLEQLMTVLRRVQSDMTGGQAGTGGPVIANKTKSEVIAILGSRGGVGCTSIGVNLGCTLSADPNNNVGLVDLDLALGDADLALDLMGDHTIADLAMNIERLDMNFIRRALVKHPGSGLSLLSRPMQMTDISVIHEDHLQRIIKLLEVNYTHLLLDLSKALLPTDLMALRLADTILLVTQLELSCLRNVVRILMALGTEDGLVDKIRVVCNRVGSEIGDHEISLKKAEETIGRPIFWQIPNDAKAMMGARVAGIPLIQHAPRSRAQQSIQGLGQALCGKTTNAPDSGKKSGGSLWSTLIGGRNK